MFPECAHLHMSKAFRGYVMLWGMLTYGSKPSLVVTEGKFGRPVLP